MVNTFSKMSKNTRQYKKHMNSILEKSNEQTKQTRADVMSICV